MAVMVEPGVEMDGAAVVGAGRAAVQVAEHATHPLLGAVEAASGQVRAAADTAVWRLSDTELESAIGECERLRAQTHSVELGLIREVDGRALGTRLGAASTTAWLRHRFRIRPGHAKSLVHTANAVGDADEEMLDYAANVSSRSGRGLRDTGKALAAGAISPEHAAIVDKIMAKVPREIGIEQAAQAESDLAGFCHEYDPGSVAKLGDYMLEVMRADTLEDEDEHRHHHRKLRLDEHTGGISGQMTRDGIALLRTALDPLAAPTPSADGQPDLRTPGQRLADALVELARRAIASDQFATNHGISHRVMVSIGLDSLTAAAGAEPDSDDSGPGRPSRDTSTTPATANPPGAAAGNEACDDLATPGETRPDEPTFDDKTTSGAASGSEPSSGAAAGNGIPIGWWIDRPLPSWATGDNGGVPPAQLEWGSLISASTALRMTCHASMQRVLLDPAGAVLDVGRERRTVTSAQYAALIARDGGCTFPGCTRPASWCIAHHVKHWAKGGTTRLGNLVLLCGHHHRVVHHHGWDVVIDADQLPTFHPPRWVDPGRQPRRNSRPRLQRINRPPSSRSEWPES